jgi:hypothetical protein
MGLSVESFSGVTGDSSPVSPQQTDTQSSDTSQPQNLYTQGPAQQQGADNPAWAPFLEGIPSVFHNKLKGQLRSWDENYRGLETRYQELEGRYKPYEGVDPQAIGYGLNLLQQVNNNPQELHRLLTEHLTQQGMLQAPDEELQLDQDPYLAQLEQRQFDLDARQQKMDQYVQEQVYNQQVEGYQKQIDKQVQGLITKYGEAAVDVQDVLGRMFNQVNQDKQIDAEAAFAEQKAVFQRIYQKQTQGRRAPSVIPPTGTIAPSGGDTPVSKMNEQQRQDYLVQMLTFANNNGG